MAGRAECGGVVVTGVLAVWLALASAGDATAARIRGVADPCTGTCEFSLCVASRSRLVACADACQLDLRVTMRPNSTRRRKRRTMIRVPDPRNHRPQPRHVSATVTCVAVQRECRPCRSDADCDDGNPRTRDECHPMPGNCAHVCS